MYAQQLKRKWALPKEQAGVKTASSYLDKVIIVTHINQLPVFLVEIYFSSLTAV